MKIKNKQKIIIKNIILYQNIKIALKWILKSNKNMR